MPNKATTAHRTIDVHQHLLGEPLIEALESGFAQSRMGEARKLSRVREWFAAWAELGWICAPDLEDLIQS